MVCIMKAFILAAGFGERLRPLTDSLPKPLVRLRGVPLICYSLALLKRAGIGDIVCNLHYRGDDIVSFFRQHDNFGFSVEFSRESEILGTGGGVMKCRDLFTRDMVLINSDIVTDLDLAALIDEYHRKKSAGMVALHRSPAGAATVSLDRKRVVDFKNFLHSGVAPSHDYMGVAVLGQAIYDYLTPEHSSIVYTGYTGLVTSPRGLDYYEHRGFWRDMGSLDSYRRAEEGLGGLPDLVRDAAALLG
jgi:mannose-1-phosphate guanylyltransferase